MNPRFDIDHFKHINDTYGHYVGDLVLRQIGAVCKKELRNIDLCGRLGGEEFIVALPETPLENAVAVAHKLRQAIKAIRVPAKDSEIAFSASFGVSVLRENETSSEIAIDRADKALYRAKRAGRDRVECE